MGRGFPIPLCTSVNYTLSQSQGWKCSHPFGVTWEWPPPRGCWLTRDHTFKDKKVLSRSPRRTSTRTRNTLHLLPGAGARCSGTDELSPSKFHLTRQTQLGPKIDVLDPHVSLASCGPHQGLSYVLKLKEKKKGHWSPQAAAFPDPCIQLQIPFTLMREFHLPLE